MPDHKSIIKTLHLPEQHKEYMLFQGLSLKLQFAGFIDWDHALKATWMKTKSIQVLGNYHILFDKINPIQVIIVLWCGQISLDMHNDVLLGDLQEDIGKIIT